MVSLVVSPVRPLSPQLKAQSSFTREADMLVPLLAGVGQSFVTRLGEPFFEVQTMRGIADLVFANIDNDVISRRLEAQLSPVTEIAEVATLLTLGPRVPGGVAESFQTKEISERTNLSANHLRSAILPRLTEKGWISPKGRGWMLTAEFKPPVRSMTAVEVKRYEWRRALSQAVSYSEFSDAAYVAMDHSRIKNNRLLQPAFEFTGIGLLTVRPGMEQGAVERIFTARRKRPRGLPHAVVAERIAALIESQRRSGEVGLVFGKFLTTSSGPDPRFA